VATQTRIDKIDGGKRKINDHPLLRINPVQPINQNNQNNETEASHIKVFS
jgi:hypothetical protein